MPVTTVRRRHKAVWQRSSERSPARIRARTAASMLPPLTMQTIVALAPARGGERERARPFRDDARARREQPHRLGDLVERDGDRLVDEPAARGPTSSAAARGRLLRRRTTAGTRSRPARRRRATAASGAAVSGSAVTTRTSGRSAFTALAMPVVSPPPPHGTITVSKSARSSQSSRPIVPLPAITASSSTGCTNKPSTPFVAPVDHRLPPDLVRHRDDRAAEPLDRVELRARRRVGRDDRRAHDRARVRPTRRPVAMFPALAVTTPPASSAGAAARIADSAPRSLNEPIGCRFSSFSQMRSSKRTSGVRRTASPSRSRARRISSSGINRPIFGELGQARCARSRARGTSCT